MAASLNELVIQSGQDWTTPIDVTTDGVTPAVVTLPVLEMRRDPNPQGQLLARLDTTGEATGTLTETSPGTWLMEIAAAETETMPFGRGFWDMFGTVDGKHVFIDSGVVLVKPRVTAVVA